MPTDEGEIVGAVRTKLKTKQRWSIMFLARTADTEAVNTAKQEKMQVIIGRQINSSSLML